MENIKDYINENLLKSNFQKIDSAPFPTYKKTYKKNEVITEFGQIERRAYFLIDGIIESNIPNGTDIRIIDFTFPNHFVCSYTSFLLQIPSEIRTIAVRDCNVEYFLKEDIENAYKDSLTANQFGRYVTEQFFIKKLKRENELLTKTAEERYLNLIKKSPEVIQNLPVNKIAKYLGIHPESLSRIRNKTIF